MIVCAGLSIILGAFGSTAKVSVESQGFVLTGVAAIAFVLFYLIISKMDDRYLRVQIVGDIRNSQIELVGDESYFGANRQKERNWEFLVFGTKVPSMLRLYITKNDQEMPFECISADNIRPYMASGQVISWRFDEKKSAIFHKETLVATIGSCGSNSIRSSDFGAAVKDLVLSVIPGAIAAEVPKDDVKQIFEDFESDVTYVRRNARAKAASFGVDAIKLLAQKISDPNSTYRGRLGAVVAMAEIVRTNKDKRTAIGGLLTAEEIKWIINSAADNDRTMRIYATEILYDLGDYRAVVPSINKIKEDGISEDGRYNIVIVISGAIQYYKMTQKEKLNIAKELSSMKSSKTPKTNELIDKVLTDLSNK